MIRRSGVPAILTVHGWVMDEAITALRMNPRGNFHYIFRIINWILHRLIFIPLIYSRVTAIARIKLEKNGINGVVIPNAFITADVDKKVANCKNLSFDDFTLVTYVSVGGSLIKGMERLSRIITEVNKRTDRKIQLLVFGTPVETDNPHIKMMAYRDDFLCYLKSADMIILGYEMIELGYAAMEAGYLSVPIAKFKSEFEELEDGVHGIIAESEEDMIKKLVKTIEDPSLVREWGENLRAHVLKTRSPQVIGEKWRRLILEVTGMSPDATGKG
ncbi:glycosyltransferase [Methanothermobacter thermautotrophicus]|nr:glycosyltransferase [Methanothermobacter thermautotrophicus]